MHLASRTFKFWREPPNTKPRSLLYFTAYTAISWCRTSEYENFTIVSPSRTDGHTITDGHCNISRTRQIQRMFGLWISQGSHSDRKPWKNGKAFSSQGTVRQFWSDGKDRENHTKYWKFQWISDKYYLLFFSDIYMNFVLFAKMDQVFS